MKERARELLYLRKEGEKSIERGDTGCGRQMWLV